MGDTGIVSDVTGLSKDEGRTAVVHSNRFLVHALPMDRASASRHEASRRRKRTDAMTSVMSTDDGQGRTEGRTDGRTGPEGSFSFDALGLRAQKRNF